MVEITVSRWAELECSEANIVQSLVIDAESLVGIFNELMHRQRRVVGFDDRIWYLEEIQIL